MTKKVLSDLETTITIMSSTAEERLLGRRVDAMLIPSELRSTSPQACNDCVVVVSVMSQAWLHE